MTAAETGGALLEAMRDDPDDAARRLVYSDWLEENGRQGKAKGVRWALANGKVPFCWKLANGSTYFGWHARNAPEAPCDLPHALVRHLKGIKSVGQWRRYGSRLEAELDLYAAYARWKEGESA